MHNEDLKTDKESLLKAVEQSENDGTSLNTILNRYGLLPKDIEAIMMLYRKTRSIQEVYGYIDRNYRQIEVGRTILSNKK